ncbi:peptidase S8/S53 domain-containing protein [Mariannaea sp. PMI_226]|nr:peptidase S8/S53 domain-containing protein [Mariannaea sp. PMI_226]
MHFNSDCHLGNTLHGTKTEASSHDCNQVCAGSLTEYCGGHGRIEIYSDSSWSLPDEASILKSLLAFNSTLSRLTELSSTYRNDIRQLQTYQSQSSNTKRDLASLLETVTADSIAFAKATNTYRVATEAVQKVFRMAQGGDLEEELPLLTSLERAQMKTAVKQSEDLITQLASLAESLGEAITNDVWRGFNLAKSLATMDSAFELVGIPLVIGAFSLAGGLCKHTLPSLCLVDFIHGLILHHSKSSMPTTSSIPEPTTTISSIITTSSQASTDIPVPVLIMMYENTTRDQFDALVEKLPPDPRNLDISYPAVNWFSIIAYLNQTTAEKLTTNPLIEAMSLDMTSQVDDPADDLNPSEVLVTRDTTNLTETSHSTFQTRGITPVPAFVQNPAPIQLQWLSNISEPGFIHFPGSYIYPQSKSTVPDIYIIDSGLFDTHKDFQKVYNANGRDSFHISKVLQKMYGSDSVVSLIHDYNGHGTCMASVAAGLLSGATKNANIVPVKVLIGDDKRYPSSAHALIESLGWIKDQVVARKKQGKSIISISIGISPLPILTPIKPPQLHFDCSLLHRADRKPISTDTMRIALERLYDAGVVAVTASGNSNHLGQTTNQHFPQAFGGPNTPLIVVGGVDKTSNKLYYSEIGNSPGDISLYAYGDLQYCASVSVSSPSDYKATLGTSLAGAQVAGLVATYMAADLPDFPKDFRQVPSYMKKTLQDYGKKFRGASPGNVAGDPNAAAPLAVGPLALPCKAGGSVAIVPDQVYNPKTIGEVLQPIIMPFVQIRGLLGLSSKIYNYVRISISSILAYF